MSMQPPAIRSIRDEKGPYPVVPLGGGCTCFMQYRTWVGGVEPGIMTLICSEGATPQPPLFGSHELIGDYTLVPWDTSFDCGIRSSDKLASNLTINWSCETLVEDPQLDPFGNISINGVAIFQGVERDPGYDIVVMENRAALGSWPTVENIPTIDAGCLSFVLNIAPPVYKFDLAVFHTSQELKTFTIISTEHVLCECECQT